LRVQITSQWNVGKIRKFAIKINCCFEIVHSMQDASVSLDIDMNSRFHNIKNKYVSTYVHVRVYLWIFKYLHVGLIKAKLSLCLTN
jgi:hypothetical protein